MKIDTARLSRQAFTLALFALVFGIIGVQASEAAEQRALLVGVSAYEHPHSFRPLSGPANDVALMKKVLLTREFQERNIVVLANQTAADSRPADRAGAHGRPTKARILVEFDRLVASAERDDVVVVLFAGHGAQQPNDNQNTDPEPDGWDEIFLPEDAGRWVNELGTVSDAIVDDEIGARLDAIRAKGAFVVFVSDSCHAESSTRKGFPVAQVSAAPRRTREVKPEQLGIPQERLQAAAAQARASSSRGGRSGRVPLERPQAGAEGGLVALYAAQSTELAPEMPLPRGAANDAENWYGLFSYTLAGVLASHPGITYRQAFQQVLESYKAEENSVPTPIMDGLDEDLDKLVFGSESRALRQWPVASDERGAPIIPAGRLHRIARGTILAIAPTATTIDEREFLGYAEVTKGDVLRSSIEPIAYAGRPAMPAIREGVFARVVDAKFDARLTVALPRPPQQLGTPGSVLSRELDRIRSEGVNGVEVDWVGEDAAAVDLRLIARDGQLWFAPPSGEVVTQGPARTPSLTIPRDGTADDTAWASFRQDIKSNLSKVANVKTLFALTRELAGTELRSDLEIELEVRRGGTGQPEPLRLDDVPDLHDRDRLTFLVRNKGRRPIDLTALFVGSDYCIRTWFPRGGSNRIQPGGTLTSRPDGDLVVNLRTVGVEHWVFLAAAAEPGGSGTVFSFLAQQCRARAQGSANRGEPVVPRNINPQITPQATILGFLNAANTAGVLRGADLPAVTLATGSSFSWTVVPPETPPQAPASKEP